MFVSSFLFSGLVVLSLSSVVSFLSSTVVFSLSSTFSFLSSLSVFSLSSVVVSSFFVSGTYSPVLYKNTSSILPHAPAFALIPTLTLTVSPAATLIESVAGFVHSHHPLSFVLAVTTSPVVTFVISTEISSASFPSPPCTCIHAAYVPSSGISTVCSIEKSRADEE